MVTLLRYFSDMKTLNITEVSRNFSSVMAAVEAGQEEVLLVRNHKPVARLVPEPAPQDALAVFGDICGALDAENCRCAFRSGSGREKVR